jgi:hypothetical protein
MIQSANPKLIHPTYDKIPALLPPEFLLDYEMNLSF